MEWNVHKIRRSRNSISPTGRPTIMFEIPSLYGAQNYMTRVPNFAIEAISCNCKILNYPCDEDLHNLCSILMAENGYKHQSDPYEAMELYIALRRILKQLIH